MPPQAGRGNLVSEGRLAECLELLAEEQERGRRLLALMHAHEQAAADRADSLMLKARGVFSYCREARDPFGFGILCTLMWVQPTVSEWQA